MGFIPSSPSEFAKELMTRLSIKESDALEMARELDVKIFANLKQDIDKVFSVPKDHKEPPPFNPQMRPAEPVPGMNDIVAGNGNGETKQNHVAPSQEETHIDEPFILHREDAGVAREIPAEEPFVRFEAQRFSGTQPTAKPATARIEGLNNEPKKERVVHYSSERTPLED